MAAMTAPAAFSGPPLVVPERPFASRGQLKVLLHHAEPLIARKDLRELVSLCCVADTLIERVQRLPEAADDFDVLLLQQIEEICERVSPKERPQELLQSLGLLDMYPFLRQGLSGERLEPVSKNLGGSYFNYVSLLNQVVMMGTQLYHDACVPQHHKYCAHQVALLYQCLNMLQGDTKPIRRLVEARFDEIKTITESKNPVLDMDLSDWLQEITWLCREEIKSCPPYVHKKMAHVTSILRTRC